VDIPVLTDKDINDLQNFCCKHKMDFVAASFVQSKADVQFIREVLDAAGGQDVRRTSCTRSLLCPALLLLLLLLMDQPCAVSGGYC
jgi:hypothetical protein